MRILRFILFGLAFVPMAFFILVAIVVSWIVEAHVESTRDHS